MILSGFHICHTWNFLSLNFVTFSLRFRYVVGTAVRSILPTAPAAVLAGSVRSPLTGIGAAAASERAAAYRISSSGTLVYGSAAWSGSAPSLCCWQLTGEPQWRRRRDWSGRRGRRLPLCRGLFLCRRRCWHDRFKSGSLVYRPAFLAPIGHQLPGGDPAGVGGQVPPVTRPYTRAVHCGQILRGGLARTKKAKQVNRPRSSRFSRPLRLPQVGIFRRRQTRRRVRRTGGLTRGFIQLQL